LENWSEYNAIRRKKKKKDADIPLKKTGVVGPFRSRRNTEH